MEEYQGFKTRLGVVGYRNYNNYEKLKQELDYFNSRRKIDLIVSGGCKGVDKMAERYADENNIPKKIFDPDPRLGRGRFAARDQQIVDLSTHLIAFPSVNGSGTQLTIGMAKNKPGIKIKVIYID